MKEGWGMTERVEFEGVTEGKLERWPLYVTTEKSG